MSGNGDRNSQETEVEEQFSDLYCEISSQSLPDRNSKEMCDSSGDAILPCSAWVKQTRNEVGHVVDG